MAKERYTEAQIEVVTFEAEDVITTSDFDNIDEEL